jgi:hypothetical protein
MTANWRRCLGLQSTLAPTSKRTTALPTKVGMRAAMAGRDTPGKRRRCQRLGGHGGAGVPGRDERVGFPLRTNSEHTMMLESFLDRQASAGFSCMPITGERAGSGKRWDAPRWANSCSIIFWSPTKMISWSSS